MQKWHTTHQYNVSSIRLRRHFHIAHDTHIVPPPPSPTQKNALGLWDSARGRELVRGKMYLKRCDKSGKLKYCRWCGPENGVCLRCYKAMPDAYTKMHYYWKWKLYAKKLLIDCFRIDFWDPGFGLFQNFGRKILSGFIVNGWEIGKIYEPVRWEKREFLYFVPSRYFLNLFKCIIYRATFLSDRLPLVLRGRK